MSTHNFANIAVVIPCFRVNGLIEDVLDRIGPEVCTIYCIDDACPDGSGDIIARHPDPRIHLIRHAANLGVGGAVITGYRQAIVDGADVIVKVDGDGQMDPSHLPRLVRPLIEGRSDYAKGNRFFHVEDLAGMPRHRLIGNAALSFLTKAATGYWNIFDPTNGYTAIHSSIVKELPLSKIDRRYFFESDILFRLNVIGAVVTDIPLPANYGQEVSNLRVRHAVIPFLFGNLRNVFKRFIYNYLLRDFNIASVEAILGALLVIGGAVYGSWQWAVAYGMGVLTPAGTVMMAALPVILGLQLLLAAMNYDLLSVPKDPLHPRLVDPEDANHRVRLRKPQHGEQHQGGDIRDESIR